MRTDTFDALVRVVYADKDIKDRIMFEYKVEEILLALEHKLYHWGYEEGQGIRVMP